MDPLSLISIGASIYQAFTGTKKDEVTGKIIKVGKGLKASKTANFAHGALLAKAGGVIAAGMLLPDQWHWLIWPGLIAVFVEWGVSLYLRVVTREGVN